MLRHPVDARDDLLGGAGPVVVEHTDGDDLGLLGHPVGGARDGPGDVRAVAVAVVGALVVVHRVEAVRGPAAEVLVADPYAGVDDVGRDAFAPRVGVRVLLVRRRLRLVDAVEAPRRGVVLGGVDGELLVLDDLAHGRVRGEALGVGLRKPRCGEAVDRGRVGAFQLATVLLGERLLVRVLVEYDDVAAAQRSGCAEPVHGSLGRVGRVGEGGQQHAYAGCSGDSRGHCKNPEAA